jgi:hypothetical protein
VICAAGSTTGDQMAETLLGIETLLKKIINNTGIDAIKWLKPF